MSENFDLLGDPIPEGHGRRGRPQHIATTENRNKVMVLLALGWANERIAKAIGITRPTLRKNYLRELKFRDEARDRVDGNLAMMLWNSARSGNVAAMKEFRKFMDKNDLMRGQADFYGQQPGKTEEAEPERKKKLGKKEQAALEAETAGRDTGWGDDLTPRLN